MPPTWLAAKAVAAVHLVLASFLLCGWFAIVTGWLLKARFVRNLWFRSVHMAGLLAVTGFAVAGKWCPLTTLEYSLLARGDGVQPSEEPFLARLIEATLYPDIDPALLFWLTVFFGLTTPLLWWLVPPRRGRLKQAPGRGEG